MFADALFILAVLCAVIVVSEVLVRKTALKHFGTALLVILVTAVVANVGIIPTTSTPDAPVPVYEVIFGYVAPLSIFWLLLAVNLRDVLKAGLPILLLFGIGAVGTTLGVLAGMWIINGPEAIGERFAALGGMFVGTYTGGSVNFNAVALEYDVMREGILYGGAVVVDNIMTALWMIATLALPRLLAPWWRSVAKTEGVVASKEVLLGIEEDTEAIHPMDFSVVLGLGLLALWLSEIIGDWLGFPSILILTVFALILAQIPFIQKFKGARMLGLFAVYLFLAVIGAYCDLGALAEIGTLGVNLLIFTTVIVVIHGALVFGAGRWMKIDLDVIAVASQANIGGSTSALALARSLGRDDLVLPGVLVGALGLAVGSFLGFFSAEFLMPLLG